MSCLMTTITYVAMPEKQYVAITTYVRVATYCFSHVTEITNYIVMM